jgi:photosynthetic reaction center cytochrome c subunit
VQAGLTSLPVDPFTPFLLAGNSSEQVRVIGNTALPTGNRDSIKQTEWTYGLMFHFSESLGVSCNYCHNSRIFSSWEQSPPTRMTAWHGLQMVKDLNVAYLDPLQPVYPTARLGETGDAPKANCNTCHLGAYKPLYGARMLDAHPELARNPPESAAVPAPGPMRTQ